MSKKLFAYFKGDRKYFAIVFFILVLIFIAGIITPIIIENKKTKWENELADKILEIEEGVKALLNTKEIQLIEKKNSIKDDLHKTLTTTHYEYGDLITLVNDESNKGYSVEVVAPNGKIIAWNDILALKQEEIFPFVYPVNQAHFFNSPLTTYYTIIDTLKVQTDIFYLLISLPVEKNYELQNKYYKQINFSEELSDRFNTLFTVHYDPYAQPSKDGRVHSTILLNSEKSKIGLVSFFKPSLSFEITEIEETSTQIQIILLLFGLVFLTLGLKSDFITIKWKSLKFILLISYLAALRFLLYWSGFPARFIDGPLVDPAYFSSTFASGLVKTPIEFFVTNIFLLLIALAFFFYIIKYFKEEHNRYRSFKIIISPFLAILVFYTLRGWAAVIKSVVFDSTIRYFKEPDLIPSFPALAMNINILIFGLAAALVIISLIILIGKFTRLMHEQSSFFQFIVLFVVMQGLCYIFFQLQSEPLITVLMCLVFLTLIFLVVLNITFRKKSVAGNIVYSSLIASVIAISMLNFFNLELEKRSLKVIAYEVNRANRELLSYLVDETLRSSLQNERLVSSLYRLNSNFDSEAFIVWSKSPLQRESLSSEIVIFDRNYNVLGRFNVGFDESLAYEELLLNSDSDIYIDEIETSENSSVKYAGVAQIQNGNIIAGYVAVAVKFSVENLGANQFPDFLESNKAALGSVVDLNTVKIFEYTNGKIEQVQGNIFPSKEQNEQIFSVKLSPDNDGWMNLSIYNEDYITYILKTERDGIEKTTVVSIKEKEITWSLYNFFKIFIVHSLFILVFVFLLLLFKSIKLKYTFRTRLLLAFLFISIIPIIALAVYNREVVRERTSTAIFNELSKRSEFLENHIKAQKSKHPEREFQTFFDNAGKELGIAFSIFENSEQVFSSRKVYYDNGLISSKLNSEAHFNLNYLSYREYLTKESIDNFVYDGYYRKFVIGDASFIVGVNDAFNKIELFYSPVDADVFLFGIYSFAVIIIVLLSTLFANQISSPIRQLTRATNAVAQGDLSIKLANNEKGELKELFDGFNSMTNELQKNQNDIAELERENAWKEMAKQVAHEIKNPLTPMKLSVQQLVASFRDKKDDYESILQKLSQAILNQIENLSLIASEFSSFAKMPSLKVEQFDLVTVIKDTANLFGDEEAEIKFNTTTEKVLVESDISQMRRMFINMIRNSLQANATLIKIALVIEDGNSIIEIEDNGKGISPENQNRIFDSNFTTKEKGLGLGLKLIKRFLENTNGEIILVSTSNQGTKFRIKIPVKSRNTVS